MDNVNNTALAKGIFRNKRTGLCIFETNYDSIKWYNVHINNIFGKFYRGCPAKLYQHDNNLIKAVILGPDKDK